MLLQWHASILNNIKAAGKCFVPGLPRLTNYHSFHTPPKSFCYTHQKQFYSFCHGAPVDSACTHKTKIDLCDRPLVTGWELSDLTAYWLYTQPVTQVLEVRPRKNRFKIRLISYKLFKLNKCVLFFRFTEYVHFTIPSLFFPLFLY